MTVENTSLDFSSVRSARACDSASPGTVTPLRAIALILAHGVVRLHQRQKDLDNRSEQRVHDAVLVTKGEKS